MISIHDWVSIWLSIAGFVITALAGTTAWLWRHSTRLTRAEVRIDGMEEAAKVDRQRTDAVVQDIRAALVRIEDKIGRKVDR